MDYDTLTLNVPVPVARAGGTGTETESVSSAVSVNTTSSEPDANMCGGQELLEVKSKDKARRYWTPREEDRLYDIWGRDNWRLTRNGKNTVYFAKWSDELRERFNIDVKAEEIQMKVNQTRAKFRSVRKAMKNDPTGSVSDAKRWKKYNIIDRILRNMHRPKDADPVPPEALLNNRDMSPERMDTPTEQGGADNVNEQGINLSLEASNNFYNNSNSNNSGNANNNGGYNTELFTDQYDEVKQEYDEVKQEYEEEFRSMPFQEQLQQYSPAEPAQLLELQTPKQQQQQQQQQQQFHSNYGQGVVAYAAPTQQPHQQQHYGSNNVAHQPITAVAYINSSNNSISVATNSNGMQPPLPIGNNAAAPTSTPTAASTAAATAASTPAPTPTATPTPTPRKRGRPYGSQTGASADSLEAMYMEEVKRKNQLIAEQTQISKQRLELEERKVELMSAFFPKCLELQTQILSHMRTLQQFQQQHQSQ